ALLLLLPLRAPASSTAFPYTPLFRSKRGRLDASIGNLGRDLADRVHEAALHRRGQRARLLLAQVGIDRVEQATRVGERIARVDVLAARQPGHRRVVRGPEVERFDAAIGA